MYIQNLKGVMIEHEEQTILEKRVEGFYLIATDKEEGGRGWSRV